MSRLVSNPAVCMHWSLLLAHIFSTWFVVLLVFEEPLLCSSDLVNFSPSLVPLEDSPGKGRQADQMTSQMLFEVVTPPHALGAQGSDQCCGLIQCPLEASVSEGDKEARRLGDSSPQIPRSQGRTGVSVSLKPAYL